VRPSVSAATPTSAGAHHESQVWQMVEEKAEASAEAALASRAIASHAEASEPQDAAVGAAECNKNQRVERALIMTTKREELAQLKEQFDELTESLTRSGKKRNGTTWQTDRLRAREQIRKQIEDLEQIPPVVTFNPAKY
jgi:hypothetical protein